MIAHIIKRLQLKRKAYELILCDRIRNGLNNKRTREVSDGFHRTIAVIKAMLKAKEKAEIAVQRAREVNDG